MKDLQHPLSWVPLKHSAQKWIWLLQHQHCNAQYQAQPQAWLQILSSGWREISWGDSLPTGGMQDLGVELLSSVSKLWPRGGNADTLLIAVKELSISQRKETLILPSKYPVSSLPQCAARLLMCASGLQNWGCFCWKTGPSSVSCHQDMKLYLCASAIRWKHIHKHPEIIHHWAMMHIYPDAWQSFYYLSISCSQNLTFSLKIQRQYFWCYCLFCEKLELCLSLLWDLNC